MAAPRRATLRDLLSPGPSLETEDDEVRVFRVAQAWGDRVPACAW